MLMNTPELVDGFVQSFATQSMQTADNYITGELTNHLFEVIFISPTLSIKCSKILLMIS